NSEPLPVRSEPNPAEKRRSEDYHLRPSSGHVPDADRTVAADGRESATIGRNGEVLHATAVAGERVTHAAGAPVPDCDRSVTSARCDPAAVGSGSNRVDRPGVVSQDLLLVLRGCRHDRVPNSYGAIKRGRRESLSVRAKGQPAHAARVTAEDQHLVSGYRV